MKAVIQKVKRATLYSDGEKYSEIKEGILILLGVNDTDNSAVADKMAQKLLKLRMHLSIKPPFLTTTFNNY